MHKPLNDDGLDQVFREARTHSAWTPQSVSEALMRAVYDLTRMGPTSANCCPARFVFVQSDEAKAKLKSALAEGNVEKTMSSPVCVIVGYDLDFAEHLPELFPHAPDAKNWFNHNRDETAFRNGTLQGGYMILAARSLGLDCGPMSGFDNAKVDEAFFKGTNVKSNFLINIGFGDGSKLFPRSPRLSFEDACQIV